MLSSRLLSSSLRQAPKKFPLLVTSRLFSSVVIASAKQIPVITAATWSSHHHHVSTGAICTSIIAGIHPLHRAADVSNSSSCRHGKVRYFGAPKRFKGKGRYIRKQPKRPKGEPRTAWECPPAPPVINAVPKEIRQAEVARKDAEFADHLKTRIAVQLSVLRFDMTSVPMSDRVKKLFELTNGSQREVIKAQKERGIQLFQKREGDTGSSAVQIVALTTRIQQLQTHMGTYKKDHSSKRGLDALYVRRRKQLDYLERTDFDSYRNVAKTLGLLTK